MELRKRWWSVVRFPCGVFPGMKSFSIYSLAGCYLFSSTDTQRYCSLFSVLAGVVGCVVVPVSDVCGHWVCSSSQIFLEVSTQGVFGLMSHDWTIVLTLSTVCATKHRDPPHLSVFSLFFYPSFLFCLSTLGFLAWIQKRHCIWMGPLLCDWF